jgi:hypothetical protein
MNTFGKNVKSPMGASCSHAVLGGREGRISKGGIKVDWKTREREWSQDYCGNLPSSELVAYHNAKYEEKRQKAKVKVRRK